jgi:hypothetical protein
MMGDWCTFADWLPDVNEGNLVPRTRTRIATKATVVMLVVNDTRPVKATEMEPVVRFELTV